MASDLVKAKWVGPFVGELETGQTVIPGETVVELGREQAEQSDHWQLVGGKATTPPAEPKPALVSPSGGGSNA